MKTGTKILLGVGVLVAGGAFYSYRKVQDLKEVFENLEIKPDKIYDFKIGLLALNFKLRIKLINPTEKNCTVFGGKFLTLKQINVYRKDDLIASVEANISQIEIPANSLIKISDIPVAVSSSVVLEQLMTIESFSTEEITVQAVVNFLGKDYIIE